MLFVTEGSVDDGTICCVALKNELRPRLLPKK